MFFNLGNNNFISKNIREVKYKDGSKIDTPDEILEEMWAFYSKLYNKPEIIDRKNENDKLKLESEISLDEIQKVIYAKE